jgi:hypothetical protein
VSRERVPTIAGSSTSSGKVVDEIDRDVSERLVADLEEHAGRALRQLARKAVVALGLPAAGVGAGVAGTLAVQDDVPAPVVAPGTGPSPTAGQVTDEIPPSLLVPPASDHVRDACDRAGDEARRAIVDARLCVDAFSRAAESCDYFPSIDRPRRPRDRQDYQE